MDRPSRSAHHPKARRPLTDATSRANTATPPPPPPRSKTSHIPRPPLPHHESLSPNGGAIGGRYPAAENKHLSNVANAETGTSNNRNSTISTASTNTNGSRRRKTHIGPWQLGKTIGEGGCSRVRAVRHAVTGQLGAAKIISKKTADKVKAQSLLNLYDRAETDPTLKQQATLMPFGLEREIVIMKLLNHANIVKLFDVWENRSELYLIMEYVEGGELFGYIDENVGLPELETVFIFRQIIAALLYCHRLHIHHRDLKPENILVDADNMNIKLVDFGMAALQPEGRWLSTPCGSPHYAAPEVIRYKQYDGGQADVWSCGIILYVMLTGQPPFTYNDDRQDLTHLFKLVAQAKYRMPDHLGAEAKDLIRKILVPDPRKRINIEGVWNHPFLRKYDRQMGFTPDDIESWVGPRPRIEGWNVRSIEDLDRETLRNMRTLWHSESEEHILRNLLNNEPNQEKYFYTALVKYKENQLEHWPGEPDIGYSTSDYHHTQPFSRPSRPVPHQRTKSQFSILNDEHLQSTHSFQQPPPSEQSYDPFRASREPSLANRTAYMNVTVHRGGSGGGGSGNGSRKRRSTNALGNHHGQTSSLRVETLRKSGWRSSGLSSVGSSSHHSSRRGSAGAGAAHHKQSLSKSSSNSSMWASSPPIVVRPSSSHKRGVSFAHLRKSSTASRLTAEEELAQYTPEQRKFLLLQAAEEQRIPAVAPTTPAHTPSPPATSGSVLKSAKPRLKIKNPPTPGHIIKDEVRKASVELEKALDEAFNRTSMSDSVRTSTTVDRPTPYDYETPPSSVSYRGSGASAYAADAQAFGKADTQRPLPPLPAGVVNDSPNTFLARELAETRERLAARFALVGGQGTANYNDVLHSLDRLLQPQRLAPPADANQRAVSAPQPKSPEHNGHLPMISEEAKSAADTNELAGTPNWSRGGFRVATAPMGPSRERYHGDQAQTIRLVDPSSPAVSANTHIPPLNIRKKPSGGTLAPTPTPGGTPTPTHTYGGGVQSPLPETPTPTDHRSLRHKGSRFGIADTPTLTATPTYQLPRESLDAAVQTTPTHALTPGTACKDHKDPTKKRSWFRRRASDRDQHDQYQQQDTLDVVSAPVRPRIPDAWQGLDDRLERVNKPRNVAMNAANQERKTSDGLTSLVSEFPMRGDAECEKKEKAAVAFGGLKKGFLAGLFGKKASERKEAGHLELASTDFSTCSFPSSGLSFPEGFDATAPRHTEGRNWLTRFLHIKPASKVLCFQVGRGRARQEIVRLLRDWRKYGVQDVVFDRASNIIQARVDKSNHMKIKPVSFVAELFAVLEHGRRAQLSIVRFTQTRGAASSFRKVVDILEDVFSTRGFLVEEEERKRAMAEVLDG